MQLLYVGKNLANRCRISSKMWCANRRGKVVHINWGAVNMVKRKPVRVYIKTLTKSFRSIDTAKEFMLKQKEKKENQGYCGLR